MAPLCVEAATSPWSRPPACGCAAQQLSHVTNVERVYIQCQMVTLNGTMSTYVNKSTAHLSTARHRATSAT